MYYIRNSIFLLFLENKQMQSISYVKLVNWNSLDYLKRYSFLIMSSGGSNKSWAWW